MTCLSPGNCAVFQESIRNPFGSADPFGGSAPGLFRPSVLERAYGGEQCSEMPTKSRESIFHPGGDLRKTLALQDAELKVAAQTGAEDLGG